MSRAMAAGRLTGLFLGVLCATALHAATVEIQAVNASPGASGPIPASLAHYKPFLKSYGKVGDAGSQKISAATGQTASASLAGSTLSLTTVSAANGKAIIKIAVDDRDPPQFTLKQGASTSIEIGKAGGAAVIYIITLTASE